MLRPGEAESPEYKALKKRKDIEEKIVSKLVKVILKAGYVISVFDGEEVPVKRSGKYFEVMKGLFSVDEESIKIRNKAGEYVGFVYFVYGNDGYDVIADYSANEVIEKLMVEVDAYISKLEAN